MNKFEPNINEFTRQLSSIFKHSEALTTAAQEQIKEALAVLLAKMDVVTREEFDAQVKVLARTRAKLEDLEQKVAELETQKQNESPS